MGMCWMDNIRHNCPKSCGSCSKLTIPTSTEPTKPTEPTKTTKPTKDGNNCEDKPYHNCGNSASMGMCWMDDMRQNCRKSCGLCSTGGNDCKDTIPFDGCKGYAGMCNMDNIKNSCPKTCGSCP